MPALPQPSLTVDMFTHKKRSAGGTNNSNETLLHLAVSLSHDWEPAGTTPKPWNCRHTCIRIQSLLMSLVTPVCDQLKCQETQGSITNVAFKIFKTNLTLFWVIRLCVLYYTIDWFWSPSIVFIATGSSSLPLSRDQVMPFSSPHEKVQKKCDFVFYSVPHIRQKWNLLFKMTMTDDWKCGWKSGVN